MSKDTIKGLMTIASTLIVMVLIVFCIVYPAILAFIVFGIIVTMVGIILLCVFYDFFTFLGF